MITLVVPTRNRAHTLRLVASTYYEQEGVDEIIFVIDEGHDETPKVIKALADAHPDVATKVVHNEFRIGAAAARNIGVLHARNDYILFCDDDEYLLPGYAKTCLDKLQRYDAGAVSGRNVYMMEGETPFEAVRRFGRGLRRSRPFNFLIAERVNGAIIDRDTAVPYTHSIILTRRSDLLAEPFDRFYSRGNGYREESDYQMRMFLKGRDIYITNDAYSAHLPESKVRTGGQRAPVFSRLYWSIFYTDYFFKKYYADYARKVGLRAPRLAALMAFAVFAVYRETLRPVLHHVALAAVNRRRAQETREGGMEASRS